MIAECNKYDVALAGIFNNRYHKITGSSTTPSRKEDLVDLF